MPSIFISYRREDTDYVAHAIERELSERFGKDSVFIDVDTMRLGKDFREQIRAAVGKCDVLLALIGDGWLDARDGDGTRRLDDPGDWVRVEIEAALERGVPLIPVLAGRAELPPPEDLPESLRKLLFLGATEVRAGPDFDHHVDRLARGIERTCGPAPTAAPRRSSFVRMLGATIAAVVAVALVAGVIAALMKSMAAAPRLAIEIESEPHVNVIEGGQVGLNVSEGEHVRLRATPVGIDDADAAEISWAQAGGRSIGPVPAGATLAFDAPNAAEDYVLGFEATATAGELSATRRVSVGVRARDEPPGLTVEAPARVVEGEPVTLSARAIDPEGGAVTIAWSQVRGPGVELTGADSPRATFVAPRVERATEVGFRAEARDAAGNSASDGVASTIAARQGAPPSNAEFAIERVVAVRITKCDVLEIRYVIRNLGEAPLPAGIVVTEMLPRGMTAKGRSDVEFTVREAIRPGAAHQQVVACRVHDDGAYAGRATATLDGVAVTSDRTETTASPARLEVRLDCPDHETRGPREGDVFAVITNVGDVPARNVAVGMQRPERGTGGGEWRTDEIAPGEEIRSTAFRISTTSVDPLDVAVRVTGNCTETTNDHCAF